MGDWSDAERHVDRAHEFYELGRWDDAEAELREAISVNPYQAEWHFNLGLTLDAAGKFEQAASAMAEAHSLDPQDAQSAFMAGACKLRSGGLQSAAQWFEKARSIDGQFIEPVVGLIEVNTGLGRHDEAEVAFYLAQQVAPEHAPAYGAIADSLLARGEVGRAVWCLREAARLDPNLPHVEGRLARAFVAQGRHERARQLFLRELRRDPGDTMTLLDLARLLAEMGRLVEAEEKLRRILELVPDHADALASLGDLAVERGDVEQGLHSYDLALRVDSAFGSVRRRMIELLTHRGAPADVTRASALLDEELEHAKGRPNELSVDELTHLAELLLDHRHADESWRLTRLLVQREPDSASLRHLFSVACFQKGDFAEGVSQARAALRIDPESMAPMHNLAVVYTKRGRYGRALLWCRRALAVDPDDREIRRLRSRIHLRRMGRALTRLTDRLRAKRSRQPSR